jgi:hypothetical protein
MDLGTMPASYDVGDGRQIHPPNCGEDYGKWLEH